MNVTRELVTPHNLEAERAVLGAVLVHNEALPLASAIVQPADFFRHEHVRLFRKMLTIAEQGEGIDYLTLSNALGPDLENVGGPAYIFGLTDGVPRSTNVEHYAGIVKQTAHARTVIAYARQAIETFSADPAAVGNGAGARFADAVRLAVDGAHVGQAEGVSDSLADVAARIASTSARDVVLCDLLALGEIAAFHGQPRSGKSWLKLEIAIAIATGTRALGRFDVPRPRVVLYISNEDPTEATFQRIVDLLAARGITDFPLSLRLILHKGCSLDQAVWQQRIAAEVQTHAVDVVMIDPLRSVSACVDQGPAEFQPLGAYLRRLATGGARRLSVVLGHHHTKPLAGVSDTRRLAQRMSGGGIFSVVDAPIHVEAAGECGMVVTPDGFKHIPDPAPFSVTREHGAGFVRMLATELNVPAESAALADRILEFLRHSPGSYGNQVAGNVRSSKSVVLATLKALDEGGRVDCIQARRGVQWFVRDGSV